MSIVDEIIDDTGAYDCVECGKCTSQCPVAKIDDTFAPRLLVVKALEGVEAGLSGEQDIWKCVTCDICSKKCPYNVSFIEFIRQIRNEAVFEGLTVECAQGGLMQTIGRLQATDTLRQDRLSWLTDDLEVDIDGTGDVFFFVGCAPYMDTIFEEREDYRIADITRAAVKILNAAGIVPVVSSEEVCCGHDQNWTGDGRTMEDLMDINVDLIRKSGAKTVVFTCPEGLRTFEFDYQDILGEFDFKLRHMSEFILDLIDDGKLEFSKPLSSEVTYHDPCRLGRHLGLYEPPREVLEEAGADVVEMEHAREDGACCGVNAWATCNSTSKIMQLDRLREAVATGAEQLVTACPKCLIHFHCSTWKELPCEESEVDIPLVDLLVLVADAL